MNLLKDTLTIFQKSLLKYDRKVLIEYIKQLLGQVSTEEIITHTSDYNLMVPISTLADNCVSEFNSMMRSIYVKDESSNYIGYYLHGDYGACFKNPIIVDQKMNFKEAIKFSFDLLDKCFGILFVNKDKNIILNPYHHISARMLSELDLDTLDNLTPIFYELKDDINIIPNETFKDMVELSDSLLQYRLSKINIEVKDDFLISSLKDILSKLQQNLSYDTLYESMLFLSRINDEIVANISHALIDKNGHSLNSNVEISYLIPVNYYQSVGAIYPYYGLLYTIRGYEVQDSCFAKSIQNECDIRSTTLSPFLSSNVSHYRNNGSFDISDEMYSTCIGKNHFNTPEALTCLNASNADSAILHTTYFKDSFYYAKCSVDKALQIYKEKGLL